MPPATAPAAAMGSGEATADTTIPVAVKARPQAPGEGELILWQGRAGGSRVLLETLGLFLLLGLLIWFAVSLILPHFAGSEFAGTPNASATPLILAMLIGMALIIGLPVWLRSSARGRAHYMLTNRRALVWLGDRIIGEAVLFGSEVRLIERSVEFSGALQWLDWRLKDEGMDRLRFEQLPDAATVAELAERHGARRTEWPSS
ncbi:hypothetical protein [Sandaracinobacteroides saxicola]|uniref:Uncharacterized protein n=1 Tax=Sandaracinobacteroides saxicola TaxID=2759707 RepID=A0A7G5IDM8_9SPHN|nr:hypothetical protein [Sandaracinobacteroides saxicola]QMW21470.1 hypothetical protein H3309_08480 [Sandaracinobacteroides saxicola]